MRQEWSDRCIDGTGHFQRLLVAEIQDDLVVADSVVREVDLGPLQVLVSSTYTNVTPIYVPLLLIEVALIVFALADLLRSDRRVVGGNKVVWALVIVLIATVGPIAYLLAGRKR